MAKFRCIKCNESLELNKHRRFKAKDHPCSCGGKIQGMYHCRVYGISPERIRVSHNNNYTYAPTGKPYFNAWRNGKHYVFLINIDGKFEELTFEEHNNFDFV